jgi:hypothetical protein
MKKKIRILIMIVGLSLFLLACARASSPVYNQTPAGVWDGVWHGWSSGFIIIWDTFFKVEDPTLYAPNNIGYWYNCGFFCIGPLIISLIFGLIAGIYRASQQ